MRNIEVSWEDIGKFASINEKYSELNNKKGVYLWVFNGTPNRIIYIGTGLGKGGLFDRINKERIEMLKKRHYCFRPDTGLDAYKTYLNRSAKEIEELVIEGKFWFPNNNLKEEPTFNKPEIEDFQDKVKIYITDLNQSKFSPIVENAKNLETQMQIILLYNYEIKYYKKYGFHSWLGKAEKLSIKNFETKWQELKKFNFIFLNKAQGIFNKGYETRNFFDETSFQKFMGKIQKMSIP